MNVVSHIRASAPFCTIAFALFYCGMLATARLAQTIKTVEIATTRPSGRYGCLDGLRGLLACGVMTHHSVIAFVYFRTGIWAWSGNPALDHLGRSTVALFFMITGFLFTEKVCASHVNWRVIYVSRVARLMPLYTVVVVALFMIIIALSGFRLNVSLSELLKEFAQWLAFVCFGRPDINGMQMSWTLIAGVNWSLRYEWIFYVAGLPTLFLLSRLLSRRTLLVGSLAALSVAIIASRVRGSLHGAPLYLVHFLCGVTAAFIYERELGRRIISSWYLRVALLGSLLVLGSIDELGGAPVLIADMLIFLGVLGGFSFFGTLSARPAVWLGDISYGIYLIHGLVLWSFYSLSMRMGLLGSLDSVAFVAVLPVLGAVVMALASTSYLCLERPLIDLSRKFAKASDITLPDSVTQRSVAGVIRIDS